jgi:PhzF family phenazine biosynthesis protein
MPLTVVQVDAFTAQPFAGNPAAVCVLDEPAEEPWMRNVASEMNLSETAFLNLREGGYDLRWFTPTTEVELCGHATLASAHVLWQSGRLALSEPARFHTLSGLLTAERHADWIEMDFPAMPAQPAEPPAALIEALRATPSYTGRTPWDWLIELESEQAVRQLRPQMAGLRQLGGRGFIVTARSATPGFDFVSRFFAPSAGIDEDPVTGSAHCSLALYWAAKLGQQEMTGYQASPRGGVVRVRPAGDRVKLAGQAVTVMMGELLA